MSRRRDWAGEIATLIEQMRRYYVHPEVAEQVCRVLQDRLNGGGYAEAIDEETFAQLVSTDLQSVNSDPHLFVHFIEAEIPLTDEPIVDNGPIRAEQARLSAYGFSKVDRLDGNVALLDLRKFYAPEAGGAADFAVAAMHLIATADALIFDLRLNTGGEPDMVALIASFLFDQRTHLVDLVFPAEGRTIQYWTAPVPGPVYGGTKPVYVLISGTTFSGGESMAYLLQQSGRATLHGEPSPGGPATFHYPYRVSAHLMSGVPSGFPRDPNSGTNWEGPGVLPDITLAADATFGTAYRAALDHVLSLGADGARARICAEATTARAAIAQ